MIHYNKFELVEMKSRLKELRVRDGLNQSELAKRAKISRQTVSLIEREEYTVYAISINSCTNIDTLFLPVATNFPRYITII